MELQEHTDTAFENLPDDIGCFAQMGSEGDIKYTWNPKNPEEVQAARDHFNDLKARGYLIFKIQRRKNFRPRASDRVESFQPNQKGLVFRAPKNETDGEVVSDFDPSDPGRYIATPQMRGG